MATFPAGMEQLFFVASEAATVAERRKSTFPRGAFSVLHQATGRMLEVRT